jgi:hypothetical protein
VIVESTRFELLSSDVVDDISFSQVSCRNVASIKWADDVGLREKDEKEKENFFTSALYATTSNNRAVIHTTLLALISLKQTFSNIESETVLFQPIFL